MPDSNVLEERANATRQATIGVLDSLAETARHCELPPLPEILDQHRSRLADNRYAVLVVGEAKRGKSSFINALIARDTLPTDVEVTTSQVFRVCAATREAYRLRFEDGSQREITQPDLPRYGSQAIADALGLPRLDQIIRWIEVDVPLRFLPAGVTLLDTPGLGSLYAPHLQITHRFMPEADAVIFVLDSLRPMVQSEVEFLKTLLRVTRRVFFIQTKIDQHRPEHWRDVRQRNEQILESFGQQLADRRVWPISSAHLMRAATTGDDDFLNLSRYRETAAALHAFLFHAACWGRCVEALLLSEEYHATSRNTLTTRLAALEPELPRQNSVRQVSEQRQQGFEAEWGEYGAKRLLLAADLDGAVVAAKNSIWNALRPGGEIELSAQRQIDGLKSPDDAARLGQTLAGDVSAAAAERWHSAEEQCRAECATLLEPFLASISASLSRATMPHPSLTVRPGPSRFDDDLMGALKKAGVQFGAATAGLAFGLYGSVPGTISVYTLVGGLAPTLAASSWFPPATLAMIVGVGAWVGFHGWRSARSTQIGTIHNELRNHLREVLHELRRHMLDPDPLHGSQSFVDRHFDSVYQQLVAHVQAIAERKSREARAEIARLDEQSKLDDEQRRTARERAAEHLAAWDAVGRSIVETGKELAQLEKTLPPGEAVVSGAEGAREE